jgi:hypothetical protein
MVVVNEEVGGGACSSYSTDCLIAANADSAWVNSWKYDDDWESGSSSSDGGASGGGSKNFSCRFLNEVDTEVIKLVNMDSFDDAYRSVEMGQHWGVIHFMVRDLSVPKK